jgi:glycosyltransferase involved in cell wall biosynthesis
MIRDLEAQIGHRTDASSARTRDFMRQLGLLEFCGVDEDICVNRVLRTDLSELRPVVASIGLVASGWKANVDGIDWFASEVWPRVRRPGICLNLYGWIGERWKPSEGEGIVAHGFRSDLDAVYRSIDIVINPVRYGAGLKIKTVEALGNGLPLVTSSEGARGLHAIAGTAFMVADSPADFGACLNRLIDNHDARKVLREAANRFAETHLSARACYGALVKEIHRPRVPGNRGRKDLSEEQGRA